MKRPMLSVFLLAAVLALPAVAGTKHIEESMSVRSDAEVQIEIIAGDLRIVAGRSGEVHVSGTINDRYEVFEMDGDEDDVTIRVEPLEERQRNPKFEADLEITVPAGVELTVESVSGEILVEGLSDAVSIESVSGRIEISGPLRELEIESVSGEIEIRSESTLESVSVEAVSASISMEGDLNSRGEYSFELVSGSIELRVPRSFGASYDIETFSGSIKNDFGPAPEKTEMIGSSSLRFTEAGGGARFEISNFSGVIRLLED